MASRKDDLDLMEAKARAYIQTGDLDGLERGARILLKLDEHRKLLLDLEKAGTAGRNGAERDSEKARFWTATLIPTLAFLVTAGTFFYQLQQGKVTAQAQEDSQWRMALEKVNSDSKAAPIAALEMESFFASSRYAKQSRPVAASLLSSVEDNDLFDVVASELSDDATQQNQEALIALARALTLKLHTQCQNRLKELGTDRQADPAVFAHFLNNPEEFYDDDDEAESKEERKVDTETWKLDTVIHDLNKLWTNPHLGASPAKQDLAEIAFFTYSPANYDGVNFEGALLSGAGFYGNCNLTKATYDHRQSVDHCGSAEKAQVLAAAANTSQ